jgi:hypothetical protein
VTVRPAPCQDATRLARCLLPPPSPATNQARYYGKLQRHDLSSCPARLRAVGLELSAAALSGAAAQRFATNGAGPAGSADLLREALQRHAVYSRLADMQQSGLLLGGVITQGLTQAQLFTRVVRPGLARHRATVQPILHHLQVCVCVCVEL